MGLATLNNIVEKTDTLTDGLVGYWPLNEGKDNIVYDYSGGKKHGKIMYYPIWNNNILTFNPNSINLNNFRNLNKLYTFSFWVYRSGANGINYVFDSSSGRFVISFGAGATPGKINFFDGSWKAIGPVISVNIFHHIILIFDNINSKVSLYVNNSYIGYDNYTGLNISGTTKIGSYFDGMNILFGGFIKEFRIYNKILSISEIKKLYNLGLSNIQNKKSIA